MGTLTLERRLYQILAAFAGIAAASSLFIPSTNLTVLEGVVGPANVLEQRLEFYSGFWLLMWAVSLYFFSLSPPSHNFHALSAIVWLVLTLHHSVPHGLCSALTSLYLFVLLPHLAFAIAYARPLAHWNTPKLSDPSLTTLQNALRIGSLVSLIFNGLVSFTSPSTAARLYFLRGAVTPSVTGIVTWNGALALIVAFALLETTNKTIFRLQHLIYVVGVVVTQVLFPNVVSPVAVAVYGAYSVVCILAFSV